ncbi:BamA/TamA family outer membrane protein [Roseisolibacter sp. H3M3-2]|uniref:BamA/OMP85 family outer membrane protein n=1 Tax=Roseisolibacter sp. H3M3-2 TaxID=3031323 RepID=UPI0023DB7C3C|nr:BamA/TamA family outer membrane protein [Roseisolibacter sp. H3M3-2]MDF1505242.1 BamA/TamA family outer membrane protein [Roseisolibacter sp. H3M3-2]
MPYPRLGRLRHARTALVACAGLVLAAAPAARAQTPRDDKQQTERPEVREVRFEGVRALEKDDLQEAIATRASACLGLAFTPFCWISKSPYIYERRYLDRAELARDVVRLLVYYYRRGWRDAQVDTAVTGDGEDAVRVTFRVTEGAPTVVRSIAVNDPQRQPGERPRGRRREGRLVRPRPGEPLDLDRLDSTVVDLRGVYWERGYGDVRVDRPAVAVDSAGPRQDSADVRIDVARGPLTPISAIQIVRTGELREVSDQTIRNSLLIEPGDLFVRSRVARSQRALYESGLFRSALIDTAVARDAASGRTVCAQQSSLGGTVSDPVARAPGDSSKTLVVCVVEGPKREARVSVGFSTADFGQVEGRYTHNYWLGGARVLDVSGAVGNLGAEQLFNTPPFRGANGFNLNGNAAENLRRQSGRYFAPTYQAGIDVRQRWFGSPRNTLGTGVFVHRRASPGVFVDRGQGANVSFTRALTPEVPISATYRFEVSRVDAGSVYFCVNFGVCDDPTINALQGQQRLSPLALTASINRADDPLFPTRGVLARFEAEHASGITASDFRYNRITAEASTYRRLPFRRSVLALRVRGGWVDALPGTNAAVGVQRAATDVDGQVLHPRKRFYAGGSQSVRGFGENQLGPRVLTVAPSDIRGVDSVRALPGGGADTSFACPPPATLAQCFQQRRTAISDDRFIPRPLGGTTLLEGNVELRFPVWRQLYGAVFVDGAMLGERTLRELGNGTAALTPGFGVRYLSPVGPVRVDLGIRPTLVERLPVVTQVEDSTGRRLLNLGSTRSCGSRDADDGCRRYPVSGATGFRGILNRLTLHLSIGEAF